MTPSRQGALHLSLAASIWGGVYVVSKITLATVPPFTLILLRYLVALAVLVFLCLRRREAILPAGGRATLLQIGLWGYFLSLAAQFIGTKLTSAHMGAVITSLSPLFQTAFAVLLLKEKTTVRQIIATLLSFAGILLIVGLPEQGAPDSLPGILCLLLAALLWGYYSVLAARLSTTHSPLQITTAGILIATVLTVPAAACEAGGWSVAALMTWPLVLSVLYLGVISTAVAFFCWNKGLSLLPAHQSGLFFFLQPIVGSLLGWAILDETLTPAFLAGSLLTLGGIYLTLAKPE